VLPGGYNFIELYPCQRDIWAVNSLRQLLVCRDFRKHLSGGVSGSGSGGGQLRFQPVNDVSNVMKAAIGGKHQVVIKIVK
jgi:hypothetical protein